MSPVQRSVIIFLCIVKACLFYLILPALGNDFKDFQLKKSPSVFMSQDSLDELEMDDYWKEVENIASSGEGAGRGEGGGEGEVQEEEQQKTPEGRIRCVQGRS